MTDIKKVVCDLDRLSSIGIVNYINDNVSYTKKFMDCREQLMIDPDTQRIFKESISERNITDEKEKMSELFTLISLQALMKFAGGVLKDDEIDVFMQYIATIDKDSIDKYYNGVELE